MLKRLHIGDLGTASVFQVATTPFLNNTYHRAIQEGATALLAAYTEKRLACEEVPSYPVYILSGVDAEYTTHWKDPFTDDVVTYHYSTRSLLL